MSAFEIFRENKKKEENENTLSEKYRNLSIRFSVLKWIALTVLVVFVIVSVSAHGNELSFDSIRYIIRYMKDEPVSLISDGDNFSFDYDIKNKAYVIGDDFAIVGSDGVTIYDYSGKILLSDNFILSEPVAVTNGNELIVYDLGGKEVRFYNSYSMIKRELLESPIYNVSVAENGNYAFHTASEGYRSGFSVFDSNKELLYKNNYGEMTLQSLSLSKNGSFVCAASFSSTESSISSVLYLYDISKTKPISQINIPGEYPVSINFVDDETIVLFTNESIRFYDISLENTYSYYYGEYSPLMFRISDNKVIVTYSTSLLSEENRVEIFCNSGEDKKSFIIPHTATDICCDDGFVHILENTNISTHRIDTGEIVFSKQVKQSFSRFVKIDSDKYILSRADMVQIFIYE